jgi:hypothetical protein
LLGHDIDIYEGAFHWALTAFTLYLIGIAQTLAEVDILSYIIEKQEAEHEAY